jgi:hypothetical protein
LGDRPTRRHDQQQQQQQQKQLTTDGLQRSLAEDVSSTTNGNKYLGINLILYKTTFLCIHEPLFSVLDEATSSQTVVTEVYWLYMKHIYYTKSVV